LTVDRHGGQAAVPGSVLLGLQSSLLVVLASWLTETAHLTDDRERQASKVTPMRHDYQPLMGCNSINTRTHHQSSTIQLAYYF